MKMKIDTREIEYIGLSMSFCIRDIVNGKVPKEQVKFIITNTRIENYAVLRDVIEIYNRHYWRGIEEAAEALVMEFWEDSKIRQPRLISDSFRINTASGHWAIQVMI